MSCRFSGILYLGGRRITVVFFLGYCSLFSLMATVLYGSFSYSYCTVQYARYAFYCSAVFFCVAGDAHARAIAHAGVFAL